MSTSTAPAYVNPPDERLNKALADYRKRLLEHREIEEKVKQMRMGLRDLEKSFNKTEDDIKALQSVGQIIAEVLKQLDDERCIPLISGILLVAFHVRC